MALISICARGEVYSPDQMVNPNVANRYDFVCDPAHLLSEGTVRGVNERLYQLRQTTTCEVVVVVVPDIGDITIEDWCEQVFTRWGVGKKDKDNGAMLAIVTEQHRVRIQTGYGVEGVLTDLACNNIIGQAVIPAMRDSNDLNKAVNDATALMYDALTDPAVAEELRSAQPDNYSGTLETLSMDVVWEFLQIVALCAFLLCMAIFIYDLRSTRRLDNYSRAQTWRKHLKTLFWVGVVSMGSGLIFWLIALWLYRIYRTKRIKCPTCGARMKRLSEEEDNQLLNDSQDFEERLNTVDYDVWECPTCGTIERFPYKVSQNKYTECPRCHTVAMCLVRDVVSQPATTRREGLGEKIYECQFCHHQEHKPYRIPRKEDPSAALAAAAILGAASRGGHGVGGGGFGGGFGGGSTGGGGASGSW